MTPPICVDLFSGCGGHSTGLLDAGVAVRLGVDFDAPSVATDLNHAPRGCASVNADVRELTGDHLAELVGARVELLVGGPPCRPFSVAGKRQALGDHRGGLIFEFVRLLAETRADAFIFENVPNLATPPWREEKYSTICFRLSTRSATAQSRGCSLRRTTASLRCARVGAARSRCRPLRHMHLPTLSWPQRHYVRT